MKAWLLGILVGAILLVYFNQSWQGLAVMSGSMEPAIKMGDLVIIQKAPEYEVREVISYKDKNKRIVTHRIVAKNGNNFVTEGDANRNEDRDEINMAQVMGKVVEVIPLLGRWQMNSGNIIFLILGIVVPAVALYFWKDYFFVWLIPISLSLLIIRSGQTAADLNDEVAVKNNSIKATTLVLNSESTADESNKTNLFNIGNLKANGMEVTSLRIKNSGKEKTNFYIYLKINNLADGCGEENIQLMTDSKIVYEGKFSQMNWQSEEIESGKFKDLIFILKGNSNISNQLSCNQQLVVSSKPETSEEKGLSDKKEIGNQITFNK